MQDRNPLNCNGSRGFYTHALLTLAMAGIGRSGTPPLVQAALEGPQERGAPRAGVRLGSSGPPGKVRGPLLDSYLEQLNKDPDTLLTCGYGQTARAVGGGCHADRAITR